MRRSARRRTRKPSVQHFCNRALELGAEHAKIISPQDVFTAQWVRIKCQYGCGGYGQCLTCPPYSPTPEETRKMLDEYECILLVHCKSGHDVRKIVIKLEHEAFFAGYYKAFAIGAGPCYLCDECAMDEGCPHPDLARPSMEACGIDVFKTARNAGLPIEVVPPEGGDENYYGLLLLE